jgi:hypothetical protein
LGYKQHGTRQQQTKKGQTMDTYKIIRFFKDKHENEIVEEGLSLEDAKLWCSREDTHGEDWFDGFTKE